MKKPIIGITLDSATDNDKYSYAPRPWFALRKDYANAVEQFGGVPIMLPYSKDSLQLLELIDGLIIPGGDEDIHPKFYGQEIISDRVKTNNNRAEFELNLAKEAMGKDIPILGICNGMQVMNVLLGGSLIQHIPDHYKKDVKVQEFLQNNEPINHEQPAPKDIPSHEIIIEPGSLLYELAGSKAKEMVNSTHHQAIDKLGSDLKISAKAPDGIIEAAELPSRKYLLCVQWHAEYLNSEMDKNLFRKLVEESLNYKESKQ